ncbi:MAG: flagellar biosynthetic protein FliR [Anaerolineae bacterium]|nr:flagellar biosynthetic protein FliR [Anaerolineae bacterium]
MSADVMATTQSLALVFCRLLAAFLLTPAFSVRTVPARFKVGLAFFTSLALWSGGWVALSEPLPVLPLAAAVLRESVVGAAIGFTAHLFAAIGQVAGSIIDLQVGFRAANLMNPLTSMPGSAVDQLYFLLASVLFLGLDGHHLLLMALAETFDALPLDASPGLSGQALAHLAAGVSSAVVAGVRIALPVVAVTLVLDVMLALLARAVPQIQVFFVGLPVKLGLGLGVLLLTVPVVVIIMRELLGQIPRQIELLVQAL